MCAVERSNPNVGVGQILKRYLGILQQLQTLQNLNAEFKHGFK